MQPILFLLSLARAEDLVLRHADIADGRPAAIIEGFYTAYETEHGFTLNVGDRITLATPLGSSSWVNTTTVGAGASGVGVAKTRGSAVTSVYYTTVYNGTQASTMAKAVLLALGGNYDPSLYMAPLSISGTEIEVVRMKLAGTKKRPTVWAECSFVNQSDKKNASGMITLGDVDEAFRLGEVVSAEHITRDIAIARMKEAHDLLTIGVYSQAQFDAERAKYLPYIDPTAAPPAATLVAPAPEAPEETP